MNHQVRSPHKDEFMMTADMNKITPYTEELVKLTKCYPLLDTYLRNIEFARGEQLSLGRIINTQSEPSSHT